MASNAPSRCASEHRCQDSDPLRPFGLFCLLRVQSGVQISLESRPKAPRCFISGDEELVCSGLFKPGLLCSLLVLFLEPAWGLHVRDTPRGSSALMMATPESSRPAGWRSSSDFTDILDVSKSSRKTRCVPSSASSHVLLR